LRYSDRSAANSAVFDIVDLFGVFVGGGDGFAEGTGDF
jgi:hypothetical protein